VDLELALRWLLTSSLWGWALGSAYAAYARGRLLSMARVSLEFERSQYAAYRKLFGPPKDWSDDRAVTVVYRTGRRLSYATGRDLAIRGFRTPEDTDT